MAYCRYGDEADLWVYDMGGALTCAQCPIARTTEPLADSFDATTRSAMIAHLEEHERAGERSGSAIAELRAEVAREGDQLEPRVVVQDGTRLEFALPDDLAAAYDARRREKD